METGEFTSILNTNRANAIVINCGNDSVLCINIYMPVENQKKTHVDPEIIEILEADDMYIEQCNIRNVNLAGDFNVDFGRDNNAHGVYFKYFSMRTDLYYTFDMPNADKGYTYHDPENNNYS